MNIDKTLELSGERPVTKAIRRSDSINYIAIGLTESQILSKHKTPIPTTLTVLKGCIDFEINGETKRLAQYDTYEIPVGVEHEVTGVETENIFTLIQEK